GSGYPRGAAASLPSITPPRLIAGFAGTGDRVKPPGKLSGGRVIAIDEAANSVLAARHADHDLVFHGERRQGKVVTLTRLRRFCFPDHGAGMSIEGHYARIQRRHVDASAESGHSTVNRTIDVRRRF